MPKLFKTDIESDTDLKIFVTDIRSEAHLVVFETSSPWEATDSPIWCYTEIRSEADKVIYFADGSWNANLVAFKTDIQLEAGWNDSSMSGIF